MGTCACASVCAHTCTWRPEVIPHGYVHHIFWRTGLSLAWSSPVQWGWWPWSPRDPPVLTPPAWRLQAQTSTTVSAFCVDSEAEAPPLACVASTLLVELSPHSGFLIFQGLVLAFVLLVLMNASSSLQIQTEVTHL